MSKIKKAAIILMILLISGIGSASAQEKASGRLIFGRVSQGCTGFGICYLHIEIFGFEIEYGILPRGGDASVAAETSIDESKNTYTLTFSISELNRKDPTKKAELDKGKFYVDEDIPLNNANKAYKLKRTTPVVLKAGTYNVQKNGDIAKVVIDIK
jgi:hypothetical protein